MPKERRYVEIFIYCTAVHSHAACLSFTCHTSRGIHFRGIHSRWSNLNGNRRGKRLNGDDKRWMNWTEGSNWREDLHCGW